MTPFDAAELSREPTVCVDLPRSPGVAENDFSALLRLGLPALRALDERGPPADAVGLVVCAREDGFLFVSWQPMARIEGFVDRCGSDDFAAWLRSRLALGGRFVLVVEESGAMRLAFFPKRGAGAAGGAS